MPCSPIRPDETQEDGEEGKRGRGEEGKRGRGEEGKTRSLHDET